MQPPTNADEIDLSFAENWTIRHEVLDIIKGSIESNLQAQVPLSQLEYDVFR